MDTVHKAIVYTLRINDKDLNRVEQEAEQRIGKAVQRGAQRGHQASGGTGTGSPAGGAGSRPGSARGRQQQAQAQQNTAQQQAGGIAGPSPRTRQPHASGVTTGISSLARSLTSMQRGFGQNSVLGQALRGFGVGGNGPFASFTRYFTGNINTALVSRMVNGGGALTRRALVQNLGQAALRGAGGAMFGPGGAAMAGSGAAVAGIAGVYGVKLMADHLAKSLSEAATGVRGFAKTFVTGNVSHAMHGAVSMGQGIARFGAGAIGGSLGAIAGGALGSIVGPVGTVGGALLGAGLGATMWGKVASGVVGIAHKFIDGMDTLVANLGKWSPIVNAQAHMFEVKSMLFQRQLSFAFQPVMSAWLKIKTVFMDLVSKLVPVIEPFISKVGAAMSKFADHLPVALSKLLSGLTSVIESLNQYLSYVGLHSDALDKATQGLSKAAAAILTPGKGLDDDQKKFNQGFIDSFRKAVPHAQGGQQGRYISPTVPHPATWNGVPFPGNDQAQDDDDKSKGTGTGTGVAKTASWFSEVAGRFGGARFLPGKGNSDFVSNYGFILGGQRGMAQRRPGTLTPTDPLSNARLAAFLEGIRLPGVPMVYNNNSPYFKDLSPEEQERILKQKPRSEQLDPDRFWKYTHPGMVPPRKAVPHSEGKAPPVIVPGPSFNQTFHNTFQLSVDNERNMQEALTEIRRVLTNVRDVGAAETSLHSAYVASTVQGVLY